MSGGGRVGQHRPRSPAAVRGSQGLRSTKRYQEDQSPQGQGSQGPQGLKGPKEDQGLRGLRVPKGDQGPHGPKGPKGDQGPQGNKGDDSGQMKLNPTEDFDFEGKKLTNIGAPSGGGDAVSLTKLQAPEITSLSPIPLSTSILVKCILYVGGKAINSLKQLIGVGLNTEIQVASDLRLMDNKIPSVSDIGADGETSRSQATSSLLRAKAAERAGSRRQKKVIQSR